MKGLSHRICGNHPPLKKNNPVPNLIYTFYHQLFREAKPPEESGDTSNKFFKKCNLKNRCQKCLGMTNIMIVRLLAQQYQLQYNLDGKHLGLTVERTNSL